MKTFIATVEITTGPKTIHEMKHEGVVSEEEFIERELKWAEENFESLEVLQVEKQPCR